MSKEDLSPEQLRAYENARKQLDKLIEAVESAGPGVITDLLKQIAYPRNVRIDYVVRSRGRCHAVERVRTEDVGDETRVSRDEVCLCPNMAYAELIRDLLRKDDDLA